MMHDDEVATDADQVRRLVAAQFPQWAGLPITPVPLAGTDHALYRLGDDLVARMPRIHWAVEQVEMDSRWLPRLAPHLPLPVPVPVAVGQPGEDFPWPWLVVPWLPGETPAADNADSADLAVDLGHFVKALQAIDLGEGPAKTGTTRGVPLAQRDEITRSAIEECGDRIDQARVADAWADALAAEVWSGRMRWVHGDLQAGNLLLENRRLSAVIDFSGLGLGDPAVDLMPAWSLFEPADAKRFRRAVDCDDDTWRRGRGWAVSTAVIGLPYYWDKVPAFVAQGQRQLQAVLADIA